MKKVKFNGKLSLNKETLVKLNQSEMDLVNGGVIEPTSTVRPTFYICHTHKKPCHITLPLCPTETCMTIAPMCA